MWHNNRMRYVLFILAILAGLAAGLFYGWVVSPVQLVDTAPNTLRVDYQADFVLMVAESYESDGDLETAARRLALLGGQPGEAARAAAEFGLQNGFAPRDLATLQTLLNDLQAWNPAGVPAATPAATDTP